MSRRRSGFVVSGSLMMIFFLIVSLMVLSGLLSGYEQIEVNGQARFYRIHVPEGYEGSEPVPLVLVLHGGGGNAKSIEKHTGFSEKAEEEGFIVVYPEGMGRWFPHRLLTWNVGFCCGYALEQESDDVSFIRELILKLCEEYEIDDQMIFVTGMSNGGMMSYRLAAELSDLIAAAAPVAGSIGGCADNGSMLWMPSVAEHPVSIAAFNGMLDGRVPYEGGCATDENAKGAYSYLSVNESIGFWVDVDGCSHDASYEVSDSGNVIIRTFGGGEEGTEVVAYSIVDGGHVWPGGTGSGMEDEQTAEVSATDLIWAFFSTHKKQ